MQAVPTANNNHQQTDSEHLVFNAADQLFALPCEDVLQLLDIPACTAIPLAPPSVRGVIEVQGTTVPLIDLRILLGAKSLHEEMQDLIATIAARRQEHVNWLKRLKEAVYHDQEITVQTDPHKCNFGLWYDRYSTSSSSFASYMRRFDKPHKAVHGVAVRAKELMLAGRAEEAKDLLHETEHSVLAGLLALFDGFEAKLTRHTHEYAIVIKRSDDVFALAVDSLAVFDRFSEITGALPAALTGSKRQFVTGIGRMTVGNAVQEVLILDPALLRSAEGA